MSTIPKTILLVEDEVFIAMAEEQMLRKNGYEIISAVDGEEAVECVRNNPDIDLVLMDIDLGKGIDGTEAARRILEDHTVPIVFLTSHAEKEMVERVKGITRYGYVIKNSGDFVLLSSIDMAFELFNAHKSIQDKIEAVEESKEKFKSTYEQAIVGMAVVAPDGTFIDVNQRFCDIVGYTREELTEMDFRDITHPDDIALDEDQIAKVVRGETDSFVIEKRYLHKLGHTVWIRLYSSVVRFPDGSIKYAVPIIDDITRSKLLEEGLTASNRNLQALWSIASIGDKDIKSICDHVLATIVTMSRSKYGFFGFINEDESVMRIHSWSGDAMKDCFMVDKPSDFIISECGVWALAVRHRKPLILNDYAAPHDAKRGYPEGHVTIDKLLVVPVFSGDVMVSVAAVANRDDDYNDTDVAEITAFLSGIQTVIDRKNAEDRLKSSESAVQALLDATPDTVFLTDIHGTTLALNATTAERLHLSVDEVIGKNQFDLLPPELAVSRKKIFDEAVRTGRIVHVADERAGMCLESTIYPIRDEESGEITRVAVYSRDVTEIRKSHEQIRMLADLSDMATVSITVHDTEGKFIYANKKTLELHGYTMEEFMKLRLHELDDPENAKLIQPRIQELREKGEASFEVVHLRKDGTPIPLAVYIRMAELSGKNVILSVGIDLSEQKRLDGEFKKLHSILQETQSISGIGGWEYDVKNGRITWTDEIYNIHGVDQNYDPNDIANDIAFYAPEWRQVLDDAFRKAVHEGIPYDLEIELIRRNGEKIWVRTIGKPVIENERVVRVHGNLMNIDERKRAEQKIQNLLNEKELILRETHHRIKNNMGVIMSMLYLHAGSLQDQSAIDALNDAHGRIQSMLLIYDKLYKSSDFRNISSREYLYDLVQGIESTFPDVFNITVEQNIEDHQLDSKILFPLGIIINELLTNSLKHAFPDTRDGVISVSFRLCPENMFELIIRDNGIGFAGADTNKVSSGFGLHVVKRLAAQIQGTISRNDTMGAEFSIMFPAPDNI